MTITFVAAGTFSATAGTSSSPNPGLPAGLATNDILVLQVMVRGTGGTIPAPSGYTQAATVNRTSSHRESVFYKVCTNSGTETAPTVTTDVSALIACRLTAWRGCDTTTVLDATTVTGDEDGADSTGTAPSITTVSPGAMVLWTWSTPDDNTVTAGSGTTAYSSDTVTGADGNIGLTYALEASAGAAGTVTLTQTANSPDNWNFITLALRPAAVAAADPSVSIRTGAKVAVEIGFGAGPYTPSPTWTDVTADVRIDQGVNTQRGRNNEFSDAQTGTLSFTLNNRGRKYDPDYSAGTYFGNLVPMTPVRVRARVGSTNYTVFTGFISSFEQSYAYPREAVCVVNAVDRFAILANRPLPSDLLQVEVLGSSPYAYYPMTDDGIVASDVSGNDHSTAYGGATSAQTSFVPGLTTTNCRVVGHGSAGDAVLISVAGEQVNIVHTLETWLQIDVLGATPTAADVGIRAAGLSNWIVIGLTPLTDESGNITSLLEVSIYDATVPIGTISAPLVLDTPYHVAAVLDSTLSTFTAYLNGVSIGTVDTTSGTFDSGTRTPNIFAGINVSPAQLEVAHLAAYTTALSSATILEHFNTGLTGGTGQLASDRLQDIATFLGLTSSTYDGSAMGENTFLAAGDSLSSDALATMQEIITSEQGRLFMSAAGVLTAQGRAADMAELTVNAVSQGTLSDSGSLAMVELQPSPATVDLLRNTISISNVGTTTTRIDATSRTRYGEASESLSVSLVDPSAVQNLGASRIRRFASPTTRIQTLAIIPKTAADSRWTVALGTELGYRYTVTWTPQGVGSAISKSVAVEGISHAFDSTTWSTTFYLAPAQTAYTAQPWFMIGDATYGKIGTSNNNHIPY